MLTNVIKRLYKLDEFNDIQRDELESKKDLFRHSFEKIRKLLIETYHDFIVELYVLDFIQLPKHLYKLASKIKRTMKLLSFFSFVSTAVYSAPNI